MYSEVSVWVDAPRSRVWRLVTDIENSADTISGIDKVEILERPIEGVRGLKWLETRTFYGKQATETMWIAEAAEPAYYVTEANSHGTHYRTEIRLDEERGGTLLKMRFEGSPESGMAKFLSVVFGWLMKRSVSKALLQDLNDLKRAAEASQGQASAS
ncbi:MAG TPA: SRPBCC family protein [Rhodothermales bacterium]